MQLMRFADVTATKNSATDTSEQVATRAILKTLPLCNVLLTVILVLGTAYRCGPFS